MLCAICDHTNETTRLCVDCREDPCNEGWSEDDAEHQLDPDRYASSAPRLADVIDRRARPPTELHRRIVSLLVLYQVQVAVRVRVRLPSGARVWRWRAGRRALTFREVAHLVGCSVGYVHKVYNAVGAR